MPESSPTNLMDLLSRAEMCFREKFGHEATIGATAPGRINLIGEHTDYNDGYVLPMAIDCHAVVLAAPTSGTTSRFFSADLEETEHHVDLRETLSPTRGAWLNYPLGVANVMKANGLDLPNLNCVLASSVPIGSGLSSSAAISVAFSFVFEQAAGASLSPDDRIRWCQKAEHDFPGVPCGIMDQTASVCGRADHAMLLDCRSHEITPVPFPAPEDAVLLVTNTNVRHNLSEDAYGTRLAECHLAAQIIREQMNLESIKALRDVDDDLLARSWSSLPPNLQKRARHVVSENRRTLDAADALKAGHLKRFGELMNQSHASLRDDFEVSCRELDVLVEAALGFTGTGVFGSRMTGGGFGGCTITLVQPEALDPLITHLKQTYQDQCHREATCFVVHPVDGGRILRVKN